jgi:signal transduction histidine kinase/ligand-binding sensor domain-containing protein
LALAGLLVAWLLPRAAGALQPGRRFDQYAHAAWPSVAQAATVYSLLPTPDGRLWAGTSEGVVRFDGQRMTLLDPQRLPGMGERDIRALHQSPDGTLWIGSYGRGLSRVRGDLLVAGPAEASSALVGSQIAEVLQTEDGVVWVGGRAGVFRFPSGGGAPLPTSEGLPDRCTHSLAVEQTAGGSTLWAGTHGGLARRDGQRWVLEVGPAPVAPKAPAVDVVLAGGDSLWAGTRGDGLWRRRDGRWTRFGVESGLGSSQVTALLRDRAGRLWVATRNGNLAWLDGDRFHPFALPPRLCGDRIEALAEDQEGGLWLGTDRCGLHRLADRPFQRLTTADGLPSDAVLGLAVGSDGTVMVGTRGQGMVRRLPGATEFQTLSCPVGLPCHDCWDISRQQSRPGAFWVVCEPNVALRWDGQQMARAALPGGLEAATFNHQARDGALWYAFYGKVVRSQGDSAVQLTEQESFQGYRILFEGRDGTMWIAADDALAAWREGRLRILRLPPAEKPVEVASFHEDESGTLWMGTKGEGIRRLRGDRFSTIGVEQGLPSGWIVQLLEDGAGRLWASSSKGIFWVSRRELDEVADGRRLRVYPSLYDANDGIQIRSESFGHPAGFKDQQGRLWFATNSGVVVVDPPGARAGPPVTIEQLSLGGQRVQLVPGSTPSATGARQDLDVTVSALTFEPAEAVSYRYRLGDGPWVELGPGRTLHEAGLSPASYRLQIAARTRESGWTPAPLQLDFKVVPPFHRSAAFLVPFVALLALGVGLLLLAVHRLRIARAQEALQTVMAERTRISREIHDTLAQAFVATSVQLECLEEALEAGPPQAAQAAKIQRHLETAKKVVEESLEEARRAVWVLRPQAIESGLVPALQTLVARLSGGTAVELKVTGDQRDLPPLVASNLLRIAHEALANARRHAGARRIEVRLSYAPRTVTLAVVDDGKGMHPRAAGEHGPNSGPGQGLLGMRERAAQMGGSLSVAAGLEAGTTVAVEVAA